LSSKSGGERLTLAAEILRGVGGILLDADGRRFVDELTTRDRLVDAMNQRTALLNNNNNDNNKNNQEFALIVTANDAKATPHAQLYTQKGLMTPLADIAAVAKWLDVDVDVVSDEFRRYDEARAAGVDAACGRATFGATSFASAPQGYFGGWITPALHYTMGGTLRRVVRIAFVCV
jgi:FAD-dependent fumarate reductase